MPFLEMNFVILLNLQNVHEYGKKRHIIYCHEYIIDDLFLHDLLCCKCKKRAAAPSFDKLAALSVH